LRRVGLLMRRAAVSIPANIAEGFSRRGDADKVRFFNIAGGSLEESRYYLILGQDLGYGETETLMELSGGSEPATERLQESHSGSWLLYLAQRDIKGAALAWLDPASK
jgi:four helix bundle protein